MWLIIFVLIWICLQSSWESFGFLWQFRLVAPPAPPATASNEYPPWLQTLPKAQRTRVLSSYHKFKHKSRPNFIFRISTKHQLQLQPYISLSLKLKLQNLDQISTEIQFRNLYKTSAEKNCSNSRFKSCLNFKILTKPCAQSMNKSLAFLPNLSFEICNKLLTTWSSSATVTTKA